MAERAARHNGRGGKKGAYSAKHNDRNFDVSKTEHIDQSLSHLNIHKRFAGEFKNAKTNEEYELAFYESVFGESLARKNKTYKAKGKSDQIKTMEEYHKSIKSCPEETYYTAGKDVDRELLWKIYTKHQAWKAERFPLCQTLTADLHADEPNAMLHIHERSVWIGHDSKGMKTVGQSKALAEMGVERPDPTKKSGKHNNAKQTFTRECRENFVQLCQEHGLEIVMETKPSGEVGLDLLEYKIQHAEQRRQEAEQNASEAQEKLQALERQAEALELRKSDLEGEIGNLNNERKTLSFLKEVEQGIYDDLKRVNEDNIEVINQNKELIQRQEGILRLIQNYEEYEEEVFDIERNMDLLEDAAAELPKATRLFKASEANTWMSRMNQILKDIRKIIEAGILRLQIFEGLYTVDENLSEPVVARFDDLDSRIFGAASRVQETEPSEKKMEELSL